MSKFSPVRPHVVNSVSYRWPQTPRNDYTTRDTDRGFTAGPGIAVLSTVLLCSINGCAQPDAGGGQSSRLRQLSADSLFFAVEQLLLESDETNISFAVTAEGAFEADLTGSLELRGRNDVNLQASGTFGPDSVDLRLISDGSTMQFGNDTLIEATAPERLHEALIVGLTRMGVLHNLARLVSNASPDHAEGGVAEWVQVRNLTRMDEEAAVLGVQFELLVEGQPSGTASLQVDAESGETLVRRQTVQFPDGEMRVVERYGG